MGRKPASTPEEFARAVNAEIRAEMGKSDETRSNRQLAAALGVSGDYVNKRVANKTPWDLADLEKLGNLFGVEPWVLIERARAAMAASQSAEVISIEERRRAPGVPPVPADVAAYDEDYPSGYDVQIAEQDEAAEADGTDEANDDEDGH